MSQVETQRKCISKTCICKNKQNLSGIDLGPCSIRKIYALRKEALQPIKYKCI